MGRMIDLFRCITEDNKSLLATTCEPESTRVLSRAHKLFCPNCKGVVQYNKGKVKSSYFSHVNLECDYIGYEPETPSHRTGKELLYSWLKSKFPTAYIEYEEHIPETGQFADVFIKHTDGEFKGLTWAFEFQHSPLSSTDWEVRHNLYKSAGIQDFWILDKAKYLKFSTAKGHTDARRRNDLEKKIYSEVGLCYFLDLKKEELTIDFNFEIHSERNVYNRKNVVTDYTYHHPKEHATHIDNIRVRMNEEFKYCVLLYGEVEEQMNDRLIWILTKLKREQKIKLEQEFKEQAIKKKAFAKSKYGEETADIIEKFIEDNKVELDIRGTQEVDIPQGYNELIEDVRCMQDLEFFEKYSELINKLSLNLREFEKLKESDELIKKLIYKINYSFDFYKLSFLIDQGSHSLEDYLIIKHQEKIPLVEYVYKEYKEVLEKLASMNPKYIYKKLGEIKSSLTVWKDNPTALDYAIEYHRLKSKDEIDKYIEEIKTKIINYNPFAGDDW